MSKEKYTSTPEEMQKAEEMMTPEQKSATEEREQFFIQEREAWDDEAWVGKNDVRKIPDDKERETMDADLKKLGSIFRGSNVGWQLDGASNISIMKGDYIGVHKDTDISIESDDLEAIDAHLSKNGYGLFLSYAENPNDKKSKRIMRRVGARGFREVSGPEHYMISAIDEKGKILENDHLNFIDTHLIQRNADGEPLGYEEAVLPEEWLTPRPTEFKGEEINISHPARVAYYKLHMERNYDMTDLKELAETGELSIEDVDKITEVVRQELVNYKKRGTDALRPILERVGGDMDAEEVFNLFAKDSRFSKMIGQPDERKKIHDLSEQIASAKDKSFKSALDIAFKIFNVDASFEDRQEKVKTLRKWVKEAEEKNKLREDI